MCLVSVIIPNFNGEKTLKDTICSVFNQSYEDWEIIIIDDGSTDESRMVVNEFSSEKVHFIQRPASRKKGGNTCRNIGIENAKGEYLVFLDSDDLLASYCIERRVAYMKEHPKLDFAVFNTYKFIGNIENSSLHTKLNTDDPLSSFLGLNCLWQTTSPIWKKTFVSKIRFNEDFQRLQDPEMVIRALSYPNVKFEIATKSLPDAYYRISIKRSKENKKRNISTNNNFDLAKKSLFYQLTQNHIYSAEKSNIKDYVRCIKTISPKLSRNDILIFNLCTNAFFLRISKNRLMRKMFSMYFSNLLHKIWGDLYVHY